ETRSQSCLMLSIVIQPAADKDLEAHRDYIAHDSPNAARRLILAAARAFERLAEHPRMGTAPDFQSDRLIGIRRWPIPGFRNHLIFYRYDHQTLQIVRVLHGAMDVERELNIRA